MKPSFALNLSPEGIGLLHRTSQGWFSVGDVGLDDPRFDEQLAFLRKTAAAIAPQGLTTKLILPNSQILYAEIDAPGPDRKSRRAQIARALEGRTPYAVDDLVFDWSGTGPMVQVAVVAQLTLDEAEAFAEEHRLAPVCFVAIPEVGHFGGEPFFGLTSGAATHLAAGERLDRDQDPVRIVGRAETLAAIVDEARDSSPMAAAPAEPQPDAPMAVDVEPDPGDARPEPATGADPHGAEDASPTFVRANTISGAVGDADLPGTDDALLPAGEGEGGAPRLGSAEPDWGDFGILSPDVVAPIETEPAEADHRRPRNAKPARAAMPRAILRNGPSEPPPPYSLRSQPKEPAVEERELTVFGARRSGKIGGKPRFLGLALIAALVLMMAAVALWSFWFGGTNPVTPAGDAAVVTPATGPQGEAAALPPPFKPAAPDPGTESIEAGAASSDATADGTDADTAQALDVPDETPPPDLAEPQDAPQAPPSIVDEAGINGAVAEAIGTEPEAAAPPAETPQAPATLPPATLPPAALPPAVEAAPEVQAAGNPPQPAPQGSPPVARAIWGETGPTDTDTAAALPPSLSEPVAPEPLASLPADDRLTADTAPPPATPPAPFGSLVQIGPDGFIIATPEGVVAPGGFTLYAGKPRPAPAVRPKTVTEAARIAAGLPPPDPLEGKPPQPRPASLAPVPAQPPVTPDPAATPAAPLPAPATAVPAPEDQTGLPPPVDPAHAALGPRSRPPEVVATAAAIRATENAVAEAAAAAAAAEARTAQATAQASRLAVDASRRPARRPSDFSQAVEAALTVAVAEPEPATALVAAAAIEEIDEPEPVSAAQNIPTRASVAKQATIQNALDLNDINLIGVYGAPRDRRALVRLSSGKYVKVQVGDRLDGGQVAAIGEGQLSYVKNGRTIVLKMIKQS